MTLTVEFDREADGRWIAEVPELADVMVYGQTRDEALAAAQALALHTLADRIEHGEADPHTLRFAPDAHAARMAAVRVRVSRW